MQQPLVCALQGCSQQHSNLTHHPAAYHSSICHDSLVQRAVIQQPHVLQDIALRPDVSHLELQLNPIHCKAWDQDEEYNVKVQCQHQQTLHIPTLLGTL